MTIIENTISSERGSMPVFMPFAIVFIVLGAIFIPNFFRPRFPLDKIKQDKSEDPAKPKNKKKRGQVMTPVMFDLETKRFT